jgi:hypothetical protein
MTDDLIDRLKGNGRVFKGEDLIAKVKYEVFVYQQYAEFVTLKGPCKVPRARRFECYLYPAMAMPKTPEQLTLLMNDGKKLDFLPAGRGAFLVTGDIY